MERSPASATAPTRTSSGARTTASSLVLIAIAAIAVWRVAVTHAVFSPTWDEPAHIYAGYAYLVDREYKFDKSHPPLARIVFAFPLRHARSPHEDIHERVGDVLASRGTYMAGVIAARRGNLLFLFAAIVGVAAFAAIRLGLTAGVIGAALFALLPPVLAHGGVATTDIPVTAAIAIALAVFSIWIRTPTWLLTAVLAVAIGAGLLTKFSFPVYFGIAAIVWLLAERRVPHPRIAAAAAGAMVIVWAGYFFRQLPRFFTGFAAVLRHGAEGHGAYFLGEVRYTGWWEYFPVILAIKTPLAFLILAATGIAVAIRTRQHRRLVVIAALMLGFVMLSRMNLGVRHILPIYIPLAALAAIGTAHLWRSRARWLLAPLGAWLIVNSVAAHPDYLPWMNALAGKHPERVVLDSNFDWGQDVVRLRDTCRAMRIPSIGVELFGTVDLGRIGMPPTHKIDPHRPAPGWYAVSEGFILPAQVMEPRAYRWLTDHRPFRRIGRTIRLYHVERRLPAGRSAGILPAGVSPRRPRCC